MRCPEKQGQRMDAKESLIQQPAQIQIWSQDGPKDIVDS